MLLEGLWIIICPGYFRQSTWTSKGTKLTQCFECVMKRLVFHVKMMAEFTETKSATVSQWSEVAKTVTGIIFRYESLAELRDIEQK